MFAKKNLIAVAALATLAVSAQAQSSVTLYGNLDVAVASLQTLNFEDGTKDRATHVASSVLTESYFGLKGQEDLGGGLKAVFKLESFVNVDTGSVDGNFWGKNAFVGVSGDFGTLTLGNHESLFKTESAAFNPFGNSAVVSPSVRLGLGLGVLGDAVAEVADFTIPMTGGSWQNSVAYTSPNLSGLTLSAQYSAKEGADYGGAYAVAANYAAGPLALSAVYGQVKQSSTENVKNRAFLLGASYDFGVAKAFAQYGQNKFTIEDETGSIKPKFFQIGAVVPVTAAGSVHASIGQTKADLGGGDVKTTDISLGYHHALSKRTSVYAAYINEKVKVSVGGDSGSESTNSYAVGVRHAF